jgi:hypothetical protein
MKQKKEQLKELRRRKKEFRELQQKEKELRLKRNLIRKRLIQRWILKNNIIIRKKWKKRRIKFISNISVVSRISKKKPIKTYLLNKRIQLKKTRIGWYYKQKEKRWAKTYGFKIRRAKVVRKFKKKLYKTNYKTTEKLKKNLFLEELLESLSILQEKNIMFI